MLSIRSSKIYFLAVLSALSIFGQSCGSDSNSQPEPDKIPQTTISRTGRELLLRDNIVVDEVKTPDSECAASWQSWRDQYSAPTPHQAYNLNSDWPLAENLYKQAFSNPSTIDLGQTFYVGHTPTRLLYMDHARDASKRSSRDLSILSTLDEIFLSTKGKTLTLVHLGLAHSLDYFFTDSHYEITYAQYPVRFKTLQGSAGLNRLMKILKNDEPQLVDHLSYVFPAVFIGKSLLAYESDPERLKFKPLFQSGASSGNIIFLGDTHGIDVKDIAAALPTSNCLKILGYDRVQFVIEGFHFDDSSISIQRMARAFDANSIFTASDKEFLKANYPEAYGILVNGQAQIYPNLIEILIKLGQYEKADIPIEYRGFEKDYAATFYDENGELADRSRYISLSSLTEQREILSRFDWSTLDSVR